MPPELDQNRLTILHTNDLHSHFGVMARISSMIEEERTREGEFLLFDIGDHMDRMAVETEGSMGQANVDVLNLTGYDAVTIGNNEGLTFTPDLLEEAYSGLLCPVVCCNVRERSSGEAPVWMKKHLILHKGNFRIGVIGATAPYTEFYGLLGWDVLDAAPEIADQVNLLKDKTDFIVLLSHLGIHTDKEIAQTTEGIGLILGGHTHHLLEEPLRIGDAYLSAAEKFGHYLGLVQLVRDPVSGRVSVESGRCLPVENGPENAEVGEAITIHRRHAQDRLKQTVAITASELKVDYNHESPFGNLLAQAVRRFTGAELSIVNSGQLLDGLPEGEISAGMLHARCPSPINPCRIRLRGEHILYSLEQSLLPEMTEKVIYGYGFRGKVLGNLCVDGLEVLYNPLAKPYHRIVQANLAGVPLEPDQIYSVGTLDMFTFGIGYQRLMQGTDKVYMLPEFIRDLLRMELQEPGAVESSFLTRWLTI
ncbi:bifunctional metallophosphatase/5'-nucleotidase [Paenibacillus tuaregi]|uniref:bifunctional metallophosphatase/5'-nucleotidase n=1 Tax=Paenibacillus tuaregi TaxID=1816681 RepID=UPI0008398641|nr:bifunctional UDP-sugar hydrolase/5'-nucleotidase [Paenibacillus tuaregi]